MVHEHVEYVEGCFTCKLKTLQWGIVPGGYRSQVSTSYYDEETLPDFPSKEETMDIRASIKNTPVKEMRLAPTGELEEA